MEVRAFPLELPATFEKLGTLECILSTIALLAPFNVHTAYALPYQPICKGRVHMFYPLGTRVFYLLSLPLSVEEVMCWVFFLFVI